MTSLLKAILEVKRVDPEKEGYRYYKEVDDWIIWEVWEIDEKDGSHGIGWLNGKGLRGNWYVCSCDFVYEGGWTPLLDTVRDIEEALDEVKRLPSNSAIPEVGKNYDLKMWATGPDGKYQPELFEPTDGTKWGQEGWYWYKDYRYLGIKNGEHLFRDNVGFDISKFDVTYLTNDMVRPHID
jgi:hypothetical protein